MPKRIRNQYGVESVVPDDYPESLIQQLGLEVLPDDPGVDAQDAQDAPQPQPEEKRRRK